MGQARNRGTREQRVAEAIDRNAAEAASAAERAQAEAKQRQIDRLAQSIALGVYAAGRQPAAQPEAS